MAWIEVHQSLPSHKKTLMAADFLSLPPAHFIGHLVCFWLWALDNVPNGSLKGIPARIIARAAQWEGDPQQFLDALLQAGFIDMVDDSYVIHDWYDYAGRLLDQRRHAAQQKRRHRELYNNKALIQAIRERDKDLCRYCGRPVNWKDRKGPDGATYDYVDPNGPTSLENVVVACRACNAGKGQRTPEEAGYVLLPPPTENLQISTQNLQISAQNQVKIKSVSTQTIPNLTIPNLTSNKNNTQPLLQENNNSGQEKFSANSGGGIIPLYEQEIGRPITPLESEMLASLEKDFPPELVREAVKRAVAAGKRNIRYIEGVLRRWRDAGVRTLQELEAFDAEWDKQKKDTQYQELAENMEKQRRAIRRKLEACLTYIRVQLGNDPDMDEVRRIAAEYGEEIVPLAVEEITGGGELWRKTARFAAS